MVNGSNTPPLYSYCREAVFKNSINNLINFEAMILNNETFDKVGSLLNIPVNTVEYHGAIGESVLFFVGMKDNTKDWLSGAALYVTEQFKIAKAERIRISRGRYTNNYPVRRFTLPFLPPIQSPVN